ncbi:hypothetical protein GCM10010831_24420 [Psychroflexus salis]|uniref:Uncharacterized protein n=1 Tax=Psychroflexus salis TaxID=1526574 RepID=A0A917A3X7_9FLAO|nr:hypothetical protein GCM10010831_24420 [Psychroflexus salis]
MLSVFEFYAGNKKQATKQLQISVELKNVEYKKAGYIIQVEVD